MVCILFALVVLLSTSSTSCVSLVKLIDNGYVDVVVAIARDVPENPTIIAELKQMFTEASPYLYNVTKKRAYFKRISILVPDTWNDTQEYQDANLETFENADFRVDTGNPNNNPYTKQLGQCGEPAIYCHLTPDYVLDTHNDRQQRWGPPGFVIVHEFLHLRYGIYDEYGEANSTVNPLFYIGQNGKPAPTGCTDKIKGHFRNKITNGRCKRNPDTGLPEADCRFIPDQQQTTKASLMNILFDSVKHLCESNPTDPYLQHNILAPNLQNRKCNNRGTYDVIMDNIDFASNNNPPRYIGDVNPDIQVLYRRQAARCRRMVLVLDKSDSMKKNNRLFVLAQAAYKFIISTVPDGVELGIVVFDKTARVTHTMRLIGSLQDRESLVAALPTMFAPHTAIGSGVTKAMDLLKLDGALTAGAKMVVLSDGQETDPGPSINEVIGSGILDNTGVTIDVIAFSNEAANNLENLAQTTGGSAFFYSEDPSSTALEDALTRTLGDTKDCPGIQPVEIQSKRIPSAQSSTAKYPIFIDTSLGKDTTFMFTPPLNVDNTGSLVITVSSPSSQNYTVSSPEYSEHNTFLVIMVVIPGLSETGYWSYSIHNVGSDGHIGVNIRSSPTVSSGGIRLKAWVNKLQVNVPTDTAIVYAEIAQGYSPVIRAHVEATIELPGQNFTRLILYDNGIGSDNFKDDGVYSNFFPDVNGDDRYSITVSVSDPANGNAMLQHRVITTSGAYDQLQAEEPMTWESIKGLQRQASGGAFKVENSKRKEEYPPGRVDDLSVESMSLEQRTVTLTWTAPGQNAFSGTVSGFEIFVHHKMEALVASHLHGYVAHESDLVEGSLEPLPAYYRHRVGIRLPRFGADNETSYTFVMWSWDELDIHSALSNYAIANLFVDPDDADFWIAPPPTPTNNESFQRTQNDGGSYGLELYIGIPMGIITFLILVICCVYILILRKKGKINGEDPKMKMQEAEEIIYQRALGRPVFTNPAYSSKPITILGRKLPDVPVTSAHAPRFPVVPVTSTHAPTSEYDSTTFYDKVA